MQLIVVCEDKKDIPKILKQYSSDIILVFAEETAQIVMNWANENNKAYTIIHHE